jgi:hypothetical protein
MPAEAKCTTWLTSSNQRQDPAAAAWLVATSPHMAAPAATASSTAGQRRLPPTATNRMTATAAATVGIPRSASWCPSELDRSLPSGT